MIARQLPAGLFDELLETHADIAILLVFTHDTPAPDGVAQRYAKDTLGKYADSLVLAIALLGLGFWASTVRLGLAVLLRVIRKGSLHIESSVEDAIARLTSELIGIDQDELHRVYGMLWDELQRGQHGLTG